MSSVDGMMQQHVSGFLRPGEVISGLGFVSNTVPVLARLIPILTMLYMGHRIVVATNQRLFFVRVDIDFFGKVKPGIGETTVLELSDLASVKPDNPRIIGHTGLEFVRRNGFVNRFMYPNSKGNVDSQAQFVLGFPAWLSNGVTSGAFQPIGAPPDPRLPPLSPPPMAGSWWLLIVLGILGVLQIGLGLANLVEGEALFAVVAVGLGSGLLYLAYGRWRAIQERKAVLAGIAVAPSSLGGDAARAASAVQGLPRWKIFAGIAAFLGLFGLFSVFNAFDERGSLELAESQVTADQTEAAQALLSGDQYRMMEAQRRLSSDQQWYDDKSSKVTKGYLFGLIFLVIAGGLGFLAFRSRKEALLAPPA